MSRLGQKNYIRYPDVVERIGSYLGTSFPLFHASLCEITRCTPHLFLPIFWFVSRELSSLVSEWKSGTMSPGRCKYNTKERQRQLSKDWIQIIQWRLFLCQNHGWDGNFSSTSYSSYFWGGSSQIKHKLWLVAEINIKLYIWYSEMWGIVAAAACWWWWLV